jgi:tetratricopeptide (TPR) repeat protein
MKFMLSISAITILTASTGLHAASYCGDLQNAYGPFDYSNGAFAGNLHTVESFHFTPEVEKLISGASGNIGGDLDYTLRAFPNHTRALTSLAKLALRDKTARVTGAKWSVECYFDRAMRFKPDDPAVRTLYGSYLYKLGRTNESVEQLNEAVRLEPHNGTANHNLGLIYFQKKDYKKALEFAKQAEKAGFPLTGLKNKLVEIGKWDDASAK